jgi:hypothetical protein
MSDTHSHLLMLVFACIFFGYALVNSLVFYRRARRVDAYRNKAMADFARSRRYGQTVWLSGVIGAIGFTVASWELILALWR